MVSSKTLVKIFPFDLLGKSDECVLNYQRCIDVDVARRSTNFFKFLEDFCFRSRLCAHVVVLKVLIPAPSSTNGHGEDVSPRAKSSILIMSVADGTADRRAETVDGFGIAATLLWKIDNRLFDGTRPYKTPERVVFHASLAQLPPIDQPHLRH